MILLEEKLSNKLPTYTSIFFKLNSFNKALFDNLVQTPNVNYDHDENQFEFPLNKLCYLVDLLTKYDDVKIKIYKKQKQQEYDISNIKFKVKPYKHQIEAIEYGLKNNSWLLLDDQGLGKTMCMIYLADILRKKEGLKHCLIICGVNSLRYNWEAEIKKFSNLSYNILGFSRTKAGKPKIASIHERCEQLKKGFSEFFIITNVETLQSKEFLQSFRKSKSKFDMIVVDEAHKLKNPSSKSAKTLLKLDAKYKVALTGTMIMNEPKNSYIPLKWIGKINSNFSTFKNMFNMYGGFGGVQVIGYKNLDLLQELISTCSLRRLKEDVLDLPEKTYQIDYVELTPDQRKLYTDVEDSILKELDLLDHKPTIMEEITINMRLRQITAYPGQLSSTVTSSAKLDRLEELVDQIISQGDKVVIFSTFKETANKIDDLLKSYGSLLCTGSQTDEEINHNKDLFQNNKNNKVLVCTWQKMGTGHTLTAANYCIFVDTPWTDADFKQASDRIYRIGQNKHVFIITLIAKDTYDERVQEILDRKECLSSYLVDGESSENLQIFS